MKRIQKALQTPLAIAVTFALALGLLLTAGIGGARASGQIQSEIYATRVQMEDIGVSLLENGSIVAYRDYDTEKADGSWLQATGELMRDVPDSPVLGKKYPEAISVKNSGSINEYVRVSIYRYWLDKDGNKMTELSPALIELHYLENGDWIRDPNADTEERSVFYYAKLLNAGETTSDLTDTVAINNYIATKVSQHKEGNKIITSYDYDGVQFCMEAEVDAVQEHNAADAVKSAWGVDAEITGGAFVLTKTAMPQPINPNDQSQSTPAESETQEPGSGTSDAESSGTNDAESSVPEQSQTQEPDQGSTEQSAPAQSGDTNP